MDIKALAGLGKVAGIGGIALGILALLLQDVLASSVFAALPAAQAGQLLLVIIVGAFVIGGLGIGAWALSQGALAKTGKPKTISATSGSAAFGDNAQGNQINITHTPDGDGAGSTAPKRDA